MQRLNDKKSAPESWSKYGEIYMDDNCCTIIVCTQCLHNVESFVEAYSAFDASTFWEHIEKKHITNNCCSIGNIDAEQEPKHKKIKVENDTYNTNIVNNTNINQMKNEIIFSEDGENESKTSTNNNGKENINENNNENCEDYYVRLIMQDLANYRDNDNQTQSLPNILQNQISIDDWHNPNAMNTMDCYRSITNEKVCTQLNADGGSVLQNVNTTQSNGLNMNNDNTEDLNIQQNTQVSFLQNINMSQSCSNGQTMNYSKSFTQNIENYNNENSNTQHNMKVSSLYNDTAIHHSFSENVADVSTATTNCKFQGTLNQIDESHNMITPPSNNATTAAISTAIVPNNNCPKTKLKFSKNNTEYVSCDKCGRHMSNEANFVKHYVRYHSDGCNRFNIRCEICYKLMLRNQFKAHFSDHSKLLLKKVYACVLCSEVLKGSHYLIYHMYTEHSKRIISSKLISSSDDNMSNINMNDALSPSRSNGQSFDINGINLEKRNFENFNMNFLESNLDNNH